MFKTAVINTRSAICLDSFTAGVKIATNNAYNEMLKLFVTITGSRSKRTTPIPAPKHQLSHAVIAIPRYVHMLESSLNENIANDSSTVTWAANMFKGVLESSIWFRTQVDITKYLKLTTKLVNMIAIAVAPLKTMDAAIIWPAPAYTRKDIEMVSRGVIPAFIAIAAYPIPIGTYPNVIGIPFLAPSINLAVLEIISPQKKLKKV